MRDLQRRVPATARLRHGTVGLPDQAAAAKDDRLPAENRDPRHGISLSVVSMSIGQKPRLSAGCPRTLETQLGSHAPQSAWKMACELTEAPEELRQYRLGADQELQLAIRNARPMTMNVYHVDDSSGISTDE
jgi:hypothetical protein